MIKTEAVTNRRNYTGRLILLSSTDLGLRALPSSKLRGCTIGMLRELQSLAAVLLTLAAWRCRCAWDRPEVSLYMHTLYMTMQQSRPCL